MSAAVVAVPTTRGGGLSGWVKRLYELDETSARVKSMEGLRGLAVLLVFFVHFDALFGEYAKGLPFLAWPTHFLGSIGNTGVDLFFLLSGYLIYSLLLKHTASTRQFLWRRVQRIYPTFLVVFGIYLALSAVFPESSRLRGLGIPGAAVYVLQNVLLLPGIFRITPIITVAWSLSYEFFFYIAATLLVRAARLWAWGPYYRIAFFATLWCCYLGANLLPDGPPHVRALMFVVGILLYEVQRFPDLTSRLGRTGELLSIVALVLSFAYLYLLDIRPDLFSFLPGWRPRPSTLPGVTGYEGPYKTLALSISLFWCTAYAFAFRGVLQRVFCWRPLRYLGNMSYSYYLIHGLTMRGLALVWAVTLRDRLCPAATLLLALPAAFAATWIGSTVLFATVERPLSLRRKHRPAGGPHGRLRTGEC